MFLTEQQASQRSKKGWQTRRRKNPGLWNKEDKQTAAAIGGATSVGVAAYGGDEYMHERAMWKEHHEYIRPNGEKVTIKGFRRKALNTKVLPALQHIDSRIDPSRSLHSPVIIGRNRMPMGLQNFGGIHVDDKSIDQIKREVPQKIVTNHAESGRDFILMNSSPAGHDLGTTLTHELGHAVGGNNVDRVPQQEWLDTTGWDNIKTKVNRYNRTSRRSPTPGPLGNIFDDIFSTDTPPTTPRHPNGPINYQATAATEDFAESFTAEMRGDGGFPTNYSPRRKHFMQQHVLADAPEAHKLNVTKIKPTKFVYKHSDSLAGAFVLGVGVAAAGLYLGDRAIDKKLQ